MPRKPSFSLFLPILALLLASLACQTVTRGQDQPPTATIPEAVQVPVKTEPVLQPPIELEATNPPPSTVVPKPDVPSITVEPLPPVQSPVSLELLSQGYGQRDQTVGYAFLVKNPLPDSAVENAQYQVAAFDASGVVVETSYGYLPIIPPDEVFGYGGTLWVDSGVTVSKVEVSLSQGDAVSPDDITDFVTAQKNYYADPYMSYITGLVQNPSDSTAYSVQVNAVLYNADDQIIGGGQYSLTFIPANSSTGVEIPVYASEEPDYYELYAAQPFSDMGYAVNSLPSGAQDLAIGKLGFTVHDQYVSTGFLIENPNPDYAIQEAQYNLTVYDAFGYVLASRSGMANLLLPGQTLGVGQDIYLNMAEAEPDNIEVQVLRGEFYPVEDMPPLTSENVAYLADEYSPRITGQIVNPYSNDVENINISAIMYDSSGEIVGGAFSYLGFVPAQGKAAFEMYLSSAGVVPASIEVYATVYSLDELK